MRHSSTNAWAKASLGGDNERPGFLIMPTDRTKAGSSTNFTASPGCARHSIAVLGRMVYPRPARTIATEAAKYITSQARVG